MDTARPESSQISATPASHHDLTSWAIWVAGALVGVAAALLRPGTFPGTLRTTSGPFLTVGAVVLAGWLLVRSGWLERLLAPVPRLGRAASVVAVLVITAGLSGLVNLDVAVVVGVPLALAAASATGVSAGWLAVGVANVANAGSFLLPTSNLTNLLVLGPDAPGPLAFARASWLAWLGVTGLTTGVVLWWILRRGDEGRPHPAAATWSLRRLAVDLTAMFLVASGLRAFVAGGIALPGPFAVRAAAGSLLASAFDNLPVASVMRPGPAPWAAILAMGAGSSLLVVGSVATVIARRIAHEGAARFTAARVTLLGAALLPLQLLVAYAGLRLTGAV